MGLIVDNFAGGGGASTGIEAALGRAVDIAINHDEQAIRMHEVNHPGTLHIRNNIWQIDPLEVTGGQAVDLAWFSPDCKHFSKAKGGKPREKSIRDLAWVVVHWVKRLQQAAKRAGDPNWRRIVKMILLENVEEFRTWGPLDAEGQPIKERAGETFEQWCAELRAAGGKIEFRELRACDYGAPTIRKRFFMVIRFDGEPIVWPDPTHGKPGSPEVLAGKRLPWRTAAEIIDWSIACPSIFERKKPLADKTLARIAHGIMKFVVNNPRPFIVGTAFKNTRASRAFDIDEPIRTATSQPEYGLVVPHVTKFRTGQVGHAAHEPLHTVTANSFIKRPGGSAPLGVVEASIAPFFARTAHGDVDSKGKRRGKGQHEATEPFPTISTSQDSALVEVAISPVIVGCGGRRGQSAPVDVAGPYPTTTTKADACLVAAHLIHRGNGEREGQAPRAMDVERALGTVVASGEKHAAVTAFLAQFSETREGRKLNPGHGADEPVSTIVQKGPLQAVVCAHLEQANGDGEKSRPGRSADAPLSTVTTEGQHQRLIASNLIKLRGTSRDGQPSDEPLHTISAGGTHMGEVRAFLLKYYGNEVDGHGLEYPLGAVTTKDRHALVIVTIDGEEYVIVDIGMRMLTPRELFNAQGFPPDYIIDHDSSGAPITKTAQVAKCGNSVCPPMAEALARAQFASAARESVAA